MTRQRSQSFRWRVRLAVSVLVSAGVAGATPGGTATPTPAELQAGLVDELSEIESITEITAENCLKWAVYCESIQEFSWLARFPDLPTEKQEEARRRASEVTDGSGPTGAAFLDAAPVFKALFGACDRLAPAVSKAIKTRNISTAEAVTAWAKQVPTLETREEYWAEWLKLETNLAQAAAKGLPSSEIARDAHRRLDRAWLAGHQRMRELVAKTLYVSMLRELIAVESVKATGKHGSILRIDRIHCNGSFTALLMSKFGQVIDDGLFREVQCKPRGRAPVVKIPLLDDEAPAAN